MSIQFAGETLYTTEELSKILNISKNTLRIHLREGNIKGRKIAKNWYVSEKDLKKFLKIDEGSNKKGNK